LPPEGSNPNHPQGVKGVREVPLVPVMAAVANAIHSAPGKRFLQPADVPAAGIGGD
jgi:CO/xanthine dehydrogenase Mo-binding subunit